MYDKVEATLFPYPAENLRVLAEFLSALMNIRLTWPIGDDDYNGITVEVVRRLQLNG